MDRYRFAKQSAYSRMRDRIAEKKKCEEKLEAPKKVVLMAMYEKSLQEIRRK